MWETEKYTDMCGWCSPFVPVSLKLFVEGGWVGRPLGKLTCMQLCVCACLYICVCMPLLWHHCWRHCSHLTVTPLWLKAWQPPTLSPSTPLLLHNLTHPTHFLSFALSPPQLYFLTHLSLLPLSVVSLFTSPTFFFLFCFNLSPPHLVSGSSLSSVMLSASTLLPVSVSMETLSGQEWLGGLWDADTDPIRSHALFLSQWATCLLQAHGVIVLTHMSPPMCKEISLLSCFSWPTSGVKKEKRMEAMRE